MESVSRMILIVLGIAVFVNLREGTLGSWVKAKFLNVFDDPPEGASFSPFGVESAQLRTSAGSAGAFIRPTSGPIISVWGDPRDGGSRRHKGVDIAPPRGTPVVAARSGRVRFAGALGSCGLTVDVDHGDGLLTRYCHLDRIGVRAGEELTGGQALGTVGDTGNAKGGTPHLHFEIRRNGTAVDPAPLISSGVAA